MTYNPHPCPGDWHWWASFDGGENCIVGPCDTREDAIQETIDDGAGEFDGRHAFTVVEAQDNHVDLARYFDVENWLERIREDMDDNQQGSDDDGDRHPLEELSDDDAAALEDSVRSAIRHWQARRGLKLRSYWFLKTRHQESIEVPCERIPHDE